MRFNHRPRERVFEKIHGGLCHHSLSSKGVPAHRTGMICQSVKGRTVGEAVHVHVLFLAHFERGHGLPLSRMSYLHTDQPCESGLIGTPDHASNLLKVYFSRYWGQITPSLFNSGTVLSADLIHLEDQKDISLQLGSNDIMLKKGKQG
jgi:hypothetical protein